MSQMFHHLSQALPLLAVISAICGFIGWWSRGMGAAKPAPAKASPGIEKPGQDRAKNLEATLEKSKTANKSLKAELDELKAASVPRESHEQTLSELETARQSLAGETRRASAMEVDLRKVQENLKVLNNRANESDKAQKERGFALQNELSKAREELAVFQSRPDESSGLLDEVERLRESVANATRYAGELRKREAAAVEELEKVKARFANSRDAANAPAPVKTAPAGDSDRVAAAKAEVLRLLEENRKKSVAAVAVPLTAIAPVAGIVGAALAETAPPEEPKVAPVAEEVVAPMALEVPSPEPAAEEAEPVAEVATPVEAAPVAEAPVAEAPVAEAPVAEAPVAEAPVAEAPVAEAPVAEAPVAEAPVAEAPIAEAPIAEAPIAEAPIAEAPIAEAPIAEAPIAEAPVEVAPVEAAPAAESLEEETPEKEESPAEAKPAGAHKAPPGELFALD